MKTSFFALALCAALFLHGCGESLNDPWYRLELPELPQTWEALLGGPHWRVEWVNANGRKQAMDIQGSAAMDISLPQTWASAVYAQPFWPEKGIGPGIFRPAGAIFPFDASRKTLVLSWQGGVDATLYQELSMLASAAGLEEDWDETEGAARPRVPRLPHHFNWPRFRQLFDDPALNAEIRADPWLADWSGIAERIALSGFDRRRLVPEPRSIQEIPVGPGPWLGSSPFAPPLLFEGIPAFPAKATPDTWVSAEGIVRCSTQAWIFISP